MIFAQHSYTIKYHLNGYKIPSLTNVHNACFYKNKYHLERDKIIREMQLIRGYLRTVMSFLDRIHISNKFIEGNIRSIKQIE